MDFLIEIEGVAPNRVDALLDLVDLRGYQVTHQSGRCFTAVREDLVGLAVSNEAWSQWVSDLKGRP